MTEIGPDYVAPLAVLPRDRTQLCTLVLMFAIAVSSSAFKSGLR